MVHAAIGVSFGDKNRRQRVDTPDVVAGPIFVILHRHGEEFARRRGKGMPRLRITKAVRVRVAVEKIIDDIVRRFSALLATNLGQRPLNDRRVRPVIAVRVNNKLIMSPRRTVSSLMENDCSSNIYLSLASCDSRLASSLLNFAEASVSTFWIEPLFVPARFFVPPVTRAFNSAEFFSGIRSVMGLLPPSREEYRTREDAVQAIIVPRRDGIVLVIAAAQAIVGQERLPSVSIVSSIEVVILFAS